MSTTTPNYGLVKPQLTDAADITAMNKNWDIIDNQIKLLNNKHRWREYTDLSEIGITEGSETFETILEEMPTYSQISYVTSGSNNKAIYPYIGGICEIKKLTNIYAKITFTMPSGGVKRGLYEKYCDYNNGGWVISNWYKFYNELNPPAASDIGATSRTLLWTGDKTSTFSEKSISISNILEYEGIEIVYVVNYMDGGVKSSGFIPCDTGEFFTLDGIHIEGIATLMSRVGYITSNGVYFNNGKQISNNGTTASASPTACIPYKIYGIK